jgi:hypothetical protein
MGGWTTGQASTGRSTDLSPLTGCGLSPPQVTTNRRLDGTMKCTVTDLGNQQYRGVFDGVWQGQKFNYTVTFSGPPNALTGKATIDRATYDWTGSVTQDQFRATFGGSRYQGHFELKRQP